MNYTKGNWEVEDTWNVICGKRFIVSAGGFTDGTHEIHDENIANAHLISAAPDMYEALKAIVELAPRDKLKLPYAIQVVGIADKALQKAEGK